MLYSIYRSLINIFGGERIRHIVGYYTACSGWSKMVHFNNRLKINAEDNTDAILAEAEYIFNNAAEFLGSEVEEEYLLAA